MQCNKQIYTNHYSVGFGILWIADSYYKVFWLTYMQQRYKYLVLFTFFNKNFLNYFFSSFASKNVLQTNFQTRLFH